MKSWYVDGDGRVFAAGSPKLPAKKYPSRGNRYGKNVRCYACNRKTRTKLDGPVACHFCAEKMGAKK
jgi:hypothetical protein